MGWQTGSGWQGLVVLPNVWPSLQSFEGGVDIRYSSVLFDRLSVDSTGALLIKATEKAPGACTAALAGLGAGNVNSGTHSYKVTFVTAGGETDAGAVSATVTTTAGNGQVALSAIPTGSTAVTSRKLYRTAAGNAVTGPWLLLATIADNSTTTYADNTADASLTTTIPSANTAIDTRTTLTNAGALVQPSLIGGTGTTSTLTLQSTSGVGTTGANIVFKVGNNGGTTAATIGNDANWTLLPGTRFDVATGSLYFGAGGTSTEIQIGTDLVQFGSSVLVRALGSYQLNGANGQLYTQGRATQLVAVGSGISTKETTIQIPADAIVYAVPVRVKTQPGGTTTMTVTATTSGTAFQKGASISTAAGTTDPGTKNTPVNYNSVAAQTVTFTFDAPTTDALGEVRIDIYYATSTPPTS